MKPLKHSLFIKTFIFLTFILFLNFFLFRCNTYAQSITPFLRSTFQNKNVYKTKDTIKLYMVYDQDNQRVVVDTNTVYKLIAPYYYYRKDKNGHRNDVSFLFIRYKFIKDGYYSYLQVLPKMYFHTVSDDPSKANGTEDMEQLKRNIADLSLIRETNHTEAKEVKTSTTVTVPLLINFSTDKQADFKLVTPNTITFTSANPNLLTLTAQNLAVVTLTSTTPTTVAFSYAIGNSAIATFPLVITSANSNLPATTAVNTVQVMTPTNNQVQIKNTTGATIVTLTLPTPYIFSLTSANTFSISGPITNNINNIPPNTTDLTSTQNIITHTNNISDIKTTSSYAWDNSKNSATITTNITTSNKTISLTKKLIYITPDKTNEPLLPLQENGKPAQDFYFKIIDTTKITPGERYFATEHLTGIPLTIPVKYRFDAPSGQPPINSAPINLSYSFGYRIKLGNNPYSDTYLRILGLIGIGVDNYFNQKSLESMPITTTSEPIWSWGTGMTVEVGSRFNFGLIYGEDRMFSGYKDWYYQGKPWIGFGFGFNFGSTSTATSVAQSK